MTLYSVSRSYIHKVFLHSIFQHFISDTLQALTDLNSTWVILYSTTHLKGIKVLNTVQQTLVFNFVI